ncbi:MAG: hypothetical protein IPM16_23060 [Chloroflexi bacterium]|nr:hypothetical protein [Chloroflexota bacterium]
MPEDNGVPHHSFDSAQPTSPFVGRADVIARIHQHLTSAAVSCAFTVVGRRRAGQTALLEHIRRRFDDTFVWAFPDMAAATDERRWLAALYQAGKDAASARGLSVHRLPRWPDEKSAAEQRVWLTETGLPELFELIRPHRRLVWVVDGVEPLAEAVARGEHPADLGAWMSGMIGPQLGMVFAAHLDQEGALVRLAPLVQPDYTARLLALTLQETGDLLNMGRDGADPELVAALYALTGGLPEWTLKAALAVHAQSHGEAYRVDHLRAVRPALAAEAAPYFKQVWENLNADEQAVVAALAYQHFERPDAPLRGEDVEAWLADSDYPLDLTAVYAVLRRLDFVEVVDNTPNQVRVRAGLFESWVRERVKPEQLRKSGGSAGTRPPDPATVRGLAILLLILLAALIIAAAINQQPSAGPSDVVPTVTLGQ